MLHQQREKIKIVYPYHKARSEKKKAILILRASIQSYSSQLLVGTDQVSPYCCNSFILFASIHLCLAEKPAPAAATAATTTTAATAAPFAPVAPVATAAPAAPAAPTAPSSASV